MTDGDTRAEMAEGDYRKGRERGRVLAAMKHRYLPVRRLAILVCYCEPGTVLTL